MYGIEAALVTTEDLRQYKYFTEIQKASLNKCVFRHFFKGINREHSSYI